MLGGPRRHVERNGAVLVLRQLLPLLLLHGRGARRQRRRGVPMGVRVCLLGHVYVRGEVVLQRGGVPAHVPRRRGLRRLVLVLLLLGLVRVLLWRVLRHGAIRQHLRRREHHLRLVLRLRLVLVVVVRWHRRHGQRRRRV
jgi:hypothetical protein